MEAPSALANASSYLPSPADLLMVFPRLFSKATSLGDMIRSGGSVIAQPTLTNATNHTVVITAGQFVQESAAAAASVVAIPQDEIGIFQALKNVASFFSYITSKWAIATFALVSLSLARPHSWATFTDIHGAGYSPESDAFLCLKPHTALVQSTVLAIRALHSATATIPLPDPKCAPSYTMSDFARMVGYAIWSCR
jgi:hypothetical protein